MGSFKKAVSFECHLSLNQTIYKMKPKNNPNTPSQKMSASPDDSQNNPQSPTEEEVKQVMENNTGNPDAPSDFSLEKLRSSFEGCISEDGKILLKNYITGFEELYKFLNLLGTVFGWVSTDVDNKIEILRQHRKGEHASEYESVQDMIAFEVNGKLIKPKARDSGTGARNLLRLHRALEYIIAFLKDVPDLGVDDKCSTLSQEAYKKTLIKHHPWVVQKAALLAMNLL